MLGFLHWGLSLFLLKKSAQRVIHPSWQSVKLIPRCDQKNNCVTWNEGLLQSALVIYEQHTQLFLVWEIALHRRLLQPQHADQFAAHTRQLA